MQSESGELSPESRVPGSPTPQQLVGAAIAPGVPREQRHRVPLLRTASQPARGHRETAGETRPTADDVEP